MKRLLAGLFAFALVLAACSNDDSHNESKDKKTEPKTEQKQQKSTEKDEKASKEKEADHAEKDKAENSQTEDQTQQAATTDNHGQTAATQNNDQQTTASTNATGPYQGQNVVPVAQNLVRQPLSDQQAQELLPEFQGALQKATAEVNQFNGYDNPYNDYAAEGEDGYYMYVFSFLNQANPGTYTIVTVDKAGDVKIVDPAYRQ